jgi:hypothetical protein
MNGSMSDPFWGWTGDWGSRRRWDLADMINFNLSFFVHNHKKLVRALKEAHTASEIDPKATVPADRIEQLNKWIQGGIKHCVDGINLREAEIAKTDLWVMMGNRHHTPVCWGELFERLRRLCDDDINVGISRECFFHYRRDKAIMLFRAEQEWSKIIEAFPSTKKEILCGIDAYGFENNVACVFHMSRVAEIGLRALGKERGIKVVKKKKPIPIEWVTWGDILAATDRKIQEIVAKPPGPQKDKALDFYKGLLSDLRTIQGFRDRTMHFREVYDPGETESAIFRTKDLMNRLASKLSESSTRQIPWSAWK